MVYNLIHLSTKFKKLCSYLDFLDVNILYSEYSYLMFLPYEARHVKETTKTTV